MKVYEVPFVIGDGTKPVMLKVTCIAEYPRGDNYGTCAFCKGDPCCDSSSSESLIGQYFIRARAAKWRTNTDGLTCPCCHGRPT